MPNLRTVAPLILLVGCESQPMGPPKTSSDEGSLAAAVAGRPLTPRPNPCTRCVLSPTTFTRRDGQTTPEGREFAGDPLTDYLLIVQDDGQGSTGAEVKLNGETIVPRAALQGPNIVELKINVPVKASNRLTVLPLGRVGAKVTVWILESGGNVWTTKASMPTPRYLHAAGVVNNALYAVGGFSQGSLDAVEAYDPTTNSWATKASLPTPRFGAAVGVVNGILYAVGGWNNLGGGLTGAVEAYDPATNSWTTKASLPTPRYLLSVGVVNGILYAVGGGIGAVFVGTVEAYDPATDSWTTKASMPTPRASLSVGVANGMLYAVGGSDPSFNLTGALEAYDPTTNSWTSKAPVPTPRGDLAVGVVNGLLYAVGGSPQGGVLGTVEAYAPLTNSWTARASLPTPRFGLAVGVVNGLLYAVGGVVGSGSAVVGTLEAYQP